MANIFYHRGTWYDENPKLTGPMDHAFWQSSAVFDGARGIHGLVPDLDRHCARLNVSAVKMGLKPLLGADEIEKLCREAVRKLDREAELYIRPMYYATEGFLAPDPESTEFVLAVHEWALPEFKGFAACLSRFRRPARDQAPTDAKAPCLYPNAGRALMDAKARGFDNAIIHDPNGNIAEFATANLFIVKDGVAHTPTANGTFLNGVTRQRVIALLRADGVEVRECTLTYADVLDADEIFSTGNYSKIMPLTQIDERSLQIGPVARKAHELYFDYARNFSVF